MDTLRYEVGGFEASNLKDGDYMIAGCSCMGMANFGFSVDFNNFDVFFAEADRILKELNPENLTSTLKSFNCNLPAKTYAIMHAFNMALNGKYSNISDNFDKRIEFFNKGSCSLSGAVNAKVAACPETSALAQGYFQKHNLNAKLMVGGLILGNKANLKEVRTEPHIYIMIEDKGTFVFDPSRPLPGSPIRANIYCIDAPQKHKFDKLKMNKVVFMKAKSIYGEVYDYYGNIFDAVTLPKDKGIWDTSIME